MRSSLGPVCALVAALAVQLCVPVSVQAQGGSVATVELTPGWATFGQALPQGAATGGLIVGSLPTQADVKNIWPDGSIRFAIVTVKAATGGTFQISPAAPSSGTFAPALPTASVVLTIGGVAYTATLPAAPASDLWLSGPRVYEARSVVAPVSSANGSAHPFLRVNFDTRVYNDGAARVDISVENIIDMVGATTISYDAVITVNGAQVFTQNSVQHFYLTRWRKTFTVGSTGFAAVRPNITPFNQAKAIPPYLSSVITNIVNSPSGPLYGILKSGALDPIMADHSGRPELAPYPDWTARYLVHKDPTQRAFVLANGDLSGSWPIHMREAETGSLHSGVGSERLVSINQRPNLWLDERAQSNNWDYIKGTPMPIREYGSDTAGPGQSPLLPDNAHQPSIAYVPYLLTGDRYYSEEMAFWANYAMVRTYPGDGLRSSLGILQGNEIRGFAWALRNIADAAAYYPDASPVRGYLSQKVINNLQWLDDYVHAQNPATNPFQILWTDKRPDGGQYISLWEETYLAHAIDRANQQGFIGGIAHRDAIARFHLKLFTSEPDYPKAQAGAYLIAVGTANPASPGFFGAFYNSMAQIWSATQGQERPFAGFYGPEARLNLMYGIQNGWPGAQASYDYLWPFIGTALAGCVNQGNINLPDLTCRPGWALDFSSTTTPTPAPAQMTSPAPGSTLTSANQIFNWNTGVGVSSYQMTVGTAPGANDIYSGPEVSSLAAFVSGLPTTGGTIWVRLSSFVNEGWHFEDYNYVAADTTTIVGNFAVANVVVAEGYSVQTTTAFGTSAGDLIVAFIGSSGPDVGAETMTVSGGGLAWTLVSRVNGQHGVAEIWTATTPTARTGIQVTSTPTMVFPYQTLVVVTFSGAAGIGATGGAFGPGGAPSVSLTTTRAGSLVYGVGNDWNGAIARTLGENQTLVHDFVNVDSGDTFWVQKLTNPVPTAGVRVTLNDTAPTDHEWNFAAVEIVPVGKASTTVTWPPPADIVYGTPLGATQLNATASVPGTFVYTPNAGSLLPIGTAQTLSVAFTPTDSANYLSATATVQITVLDKPAPTITWPIPANIVYGTALGALQLNATSSVPGTFVYTPAAGTVLPVGPAQTLSVTFTPTDSAAWSTTTRSVPITVVNGAIDLAPPPVKVGNLIAGTFSDATGHSAQSHLVYAPNAGVWWLFTLSSGHDSLNDHTVLSYRSSGPNLATATWTAGTASPHLANVSGATSSVFAGGRSLGAAVLSIGGVDYVHLFASAAFDGQASSNGHIRGKLGPTSIVWGTWNNPGSPNAGSEWQGPANSGHPPSASASHPSWGNVIGISTNGFIHHSSVTMDQEVDCNAARSTAADNSGTWSNGFGTNAVGNSPPNTTTVIDKTMIFECKSLAFAPLPSDVMMAVYSNGAVAQPNLTNLRFQKSGPTGTWTNIPISGGGNGNVFSANALIDSNDWSLVPVSTTLVYTFRRNATGTGVDGAKYVPASNTWTPMSTPASPAPPAFGTGQAFKSGAGLFGATDGTNVWLFCINTDAANSILYSKFNGTSWTPWATVPGSGGTATHIRGFISGSPRVAANQVGLTWTEGTSNFDVVTASLNTDSTIPTVTLTEPANGASVPGTSVTVSATASDDVGVVGVQFKLDGANLGAELTSGPYTIAWDASTATNGVHTLTAVARDAANNATTATAVTVTVNSDVTPPTVSITSPANGATVSGTAVTVSATAADQVGVVGVQFLLDGVAFGAELTAAPYTLNWDTTGATRNLHTLAARARDAAGHQTTSAPVTVTVTGVTPALTWPTPAIIAYGTVLDGSQLNATASVPGVFTYLPAAGTVLPVGAAQPLSVTFTPNDAVSYTTTTASVAITVVQATPALTWPPPADIVYGTALAGAQLNANTSVPGTFAYMPALGTMLSAGPAQSLSVTFTPSDTVSYTTATASVPLTVLKASPTLALTGGQFVYDSQPHTATAIAIGIGEAAVAGTFDFTYAPGGSAPPVNAGSYSVSAAFISSDPNYSSGSAVATVKIDRATPDPTWSTPADIVYGTPLGTAQLNALAAIPGAYVYNPAAGTVLQAGNGRVLSMTFTPSDPNYTSYTDTVSINVLKATPLVVWNAPAAVVVGTALSAAQLNATASVPGVFVYSPASGTVLAPGVDQTLSVNFTPNDAANYTPAAKSVTITARNQPSVALSATSAPPLATVTATIANGLGNPMDWVALVPIGGSTELDWKFLNGSRTAPAAGLTGDVTVSITLPSAAGTYVVKYYFNNTYTILATSAPITVASAAVTVSTATPSPGATISATIANGPGDITDWVGLYAAGVSGEVDWKFLNGARTAPSAGMVGATLSFTLPATPGIYFLRFYAHNTYTILATSPPINTGPAVSVTTMVGPGGTFAAQVTNGPGNAQDWVGLYAVGSSSELDWKFLNGTRTAPATGVTGASLPFALPTTPGKSYVLRYYANNTYTVLATSATITVGASNALTVNATTVAPGGNVTATVAAGPRNATDWVGLYAVGSSTELDWKFLNGSRTAPAAGVPAAVLHFSLPTTSGSYVLKLYSNNTYTVLATTPPIAVTVDAAPPSSPTISVSAASTTAGGTVAATIAGGPANARDWVGLYAVGGSVELNWKFLNGSQVAPAAGVTGAVVPFTLPMTPGSYVLRFYANDTYALLATSETITVAGSTVTVDSTTAAPGATVTATVTHGPGDSTDWLALYKVGESTEMDWKFLSGSRTAPLSGVSDASVSIALPTTPGNYVIRFYAKNSYTLLATSQTLTVQ